MRGATKGKLSLNSETFKKILIAVVIIAFFAFGDFPKYVYTIKVIAIVGLLAITRYLRKDSYISWIAIFAIWCLTSFIWAIDKRIVISYFIWFLQAILLAFSIGTSIHDTSDVEYILKCIMVGGVLVAIRSINNVSFSSLGTFRLGTNIGLNANELALKTSLGCIIAFRYFHESEQKVKKIIYLAFTLIPLVVVLLSGSRKGIVMVFAALFLFSTICSPNPIRQLRNLVIAIIGITTLYLLMARVEFFYNSFGRRFLLLFNILNDGAYVGNSIRNRFTAVDLGLEVFKNKPIIGYGLGNYIAATGLRGYAHNNYIQLLVDLGLVGITIYYSFYLKNIIGLISTIRKNRSLTAMLLSMLVIIVVIEYGLVSFNSDYIQIIVMLCFYMVQINRNEITNKKKEST